MPNFNDLVQKYGGDNPDRRNGDLWLIHSGQNIKALALLEKFNLRIEGDPAEVWVGDETPIAAWGAILGQLARNRQQLPVYLKTNADYQLLGDFSVIHQTTSPQELDLRRTLFHAPVPLSRIVFLARK